MPKNSFLAQAASRPQSTDSNSENQVFAPLKLVEPLSQAEKSQGTVDGDNLSFARPNNAVLSNLPLDVWMRVRSHVGYSLLHQGRSLLDQGQQCENIFFPTHGLISHVLSSPCGSRVATGLTGREGMIGLIEGFNQTAAMTHSIVQVAGKTCLLPAEVLRQEFQRGGALQNWFLRYMQWQIVQTSQNVLCNSVHSVEERLARLLLASQDRLGDTDVTATHEELATLLGTRRCVVTVTMGRLSKKGLISCGRGRFQVLDAHGLEKFSCSCYRVLRQQAAELRST